MPRTPLLALAAVVALTAVIASVASPESIDASAEVAPAPPLSQSPPSTGYVLAGAVDASVLSDAEEQLTAEAQARSPSESPASTTTTTLQAVVTDAEETTSTPEKSSGSTTTTTTPPTTTTTEPPDDGGIDHAAESDFVSRINSLRSSNGKGGLTRDGSLDARARDWARYMAESGSLSHSDLGSLIPPWTAAAENVGQGSSVSQIFDLLAGSSSHRSNMLGDFTHLGVGVWRDSTGLLWTAHVFTR